MDKNTLMEFAKAKYGVNDSTANICVKVVEDCFSELIKETKKSDCPVHLSSMDGTAVLVSENNFLKNSVR